METMIKLNHEASVTVLRDLTAHESSEASERSMMSLKSHGLLDS